MSALSHADLLACNVTITAADARIATILPEVTRPNLKEDEKDGGSGYELQTMRKLRKLLRDSRAWFTTAASEGS